MPSTATTAAVHTFSTTVGLLYVFNLIVGTGALALPRAFQTAGYILGAVLLLISACASYICVTFVIECLAVANFAMKNRNDESAIRQADDRTSPTTSSSEHEVSLEGPDDDERSRFRITKRIELTEMAHIFLGRTGVVFTYIALSVYLFGDLAIYSTTVPKSLMNVLCASPNTSEHDKARDAPCHEHAMLPDFVTRVFVYRTCVVIFAVFCALMVLVGMTRTKYVQLATTASRWTAFLLMIVLASIQLLANGAQTHPPAANPRGFGSFFGVAVYAFMCHHSIPGLVTPMRNTSFVSYRIGMVYALIFVFYATLSLTGSFAFDVVQDVYTLNFFHDEQTGNVFYFLVDYFLALFPVFTLTSSYIIVAITLCNNLRVLRAMCTSYWRNRSSGSESNNTGRARQNSRQHAFNDENEALLDDGGDTTTTAEDDPTTPAPRSFDEVSGDWHATLKAIALPAFVVGMPTLLSLYTDNVLLLASITGSYPGVGVQFVIPSALALGARAYLRSRRRPNNTSDELLLSSAGDEDELSLLPREVASPFRHWFWPYVTLTWAAFCVIVVSWNVFHLG